MGLLKIIFFTLICCLFNSCTNSLNPSDPINIPDTNVSFQNHILPILRRTCGLSYCHGEISPMGNVQIIDYVTLMNSYNGALVIPYNPNGSVLVQIIEYKLPHNPFLQWNLTSNQINGIKKWILEGAKNN